MKSIARFRRTLRTTALLALAASPVANAYANLLGNGGFEGAPNTQAAYGAGSTAITGWVVYAPPSNPGANIQWITNSNPYGLVTPYGNSFIDMTGLSDTAPYAGVLQGFATTVGQAYRVTFALGCDNGSSAGDFACPVSVDASVDGALAGVQTFTMSSTAAGNQWASFEYDFVATATASVLRFRGNGGGVFIGLDNVDVEAGATTPPPSGVPEPAPLALLGLGALTALVSRRRAKRDA